MNIGFVSTRFAGTDGVSLEAAKWAEVFEETGNHSCFWFSGLSDRSPLASLTVPEAHFTHPEVSVVDRQIWSQGKLPRAAHKKIISLAVLLKDQLSEFVSEYAIDVLIPENALTIPMNVPLGVAICEFVVETDIPVVAHHHDFYWERDRFEETQIGDLLESCFPPTHSSIQHVVINSEAKRELNRRKGIESVLIPNVFDFENEPSPSGDYTAGLRENIGLEPDELFVLQPTRIVERKGIEHAVELVSRLGLPKCKLVISHDAGDEGFAYRDRIVELAKEKGVDLLLVSDRVSDQRRYDANGRKLYTLWDLYRHCDLVTYPSLYEGFGNALLEAVYFKRPVMLNRYSVYIDDIEAKGFRFAEMDSAVNDSTLSEVEKLMTDSVYREEVVKHNYSVALEHYSYRVLRDRFSQDLNLPL